MFIYVVVGGREKILGVMSQLSTLLQNFCVLYLLALPSRWTAFFLNSTQLSQRP